jgi:S1-C subfamily serine protease
MKLLAALLLAPILFAAPPRGPEIVAVAVGHERATGFVAGDGRVVTVAHVVGPGITVDGRAATVIRLDRDRDLAVLRVPGIRGPRARFGGGGDTSLLGRSAPVVRRIDASVDGGPRRRALEIRADVEIGDSGAPLVTPTGRVAGVVFARSRARPGVAYATALDHSSP